VCCPKPPQASPHAIAPYLSTPRRFHLPLKNEKKRQATVFGCTGHMLNL
jgi:hypothetical protein